MPEGTHKGEPVERQAAMPRQDLAFQSIWIADPMAQDAPVVGQRGP